MLPMLLWAACTVAPNEPDRPAPSLLLITLDTVRADYLGAYGYPKPTTPALDALAADSDRYSRAVSSSPWTLPSHASLLTGLHPSQHGAHSTHPDSPQHDAWALPAEHDTIAEVLSAAGYDTAALVSNVAYLSADYALDQGFSTYDVTARRGPKLTEAALSWLDGDWDRSKPFLLFLNYMDAHRIYNMAPQPGWPTPDDTSPARLNELMKTVMVDQRDDPALKAAVTRQYEQGVVNADAAVGALLAALERRGLSDETIVVVTSDHGEYFGEHGLVEHSKDIYQEAVHVPLLVHVPGQTTGRVVDTVVSSAHLPSLLAPHLPPLAALPTPEAPVSENRYARPRDRTGPYGDRLNRVRQATWDWPLKAIRSSDGQHELYDLDADPREMRSLLPEQPMAAPALFERLPEPLRRTEAPQALGDEEALRALGYIE